MDDYTYELNALKWHQFLGTCAIFKMRASPLLNTVQIASDDDMITDAFDSTGRVLYSIEKENIVIFSRELAINFIKECSNYSGDKDKDIKRINQIFDIEA